ncbi:MAG: aldehyde dehydrogenase family protein [Hyphomonadaceae bacterium]|nr:MAG: aldehyde dehydrogenase [Caulobacteraceae bacterium]MBT9445849.1 aldehyde dehydrogenase family protein [Hyphomonadaceae bacterium]TPW05066.1 MAG: aldehyde dehydrogenase [Alphaproteobacteria bacterium]
MADDRLRRLRSLFDAQRAAHARDPTPDMATRLDRLSRLRTMVMARRAALHDALRSDFGAHDTRLTDLMEIGPVIQRVTHIERHLVDWIGPRSVDLGPEHGASRGEVLHVPKGVMGNIAPWNFPVESSLVMCADMMAAGNRVVVKPSELSPATAEAVEAAVAEFFAPEELVVVQGDAEFARAFSELPWDHLTFTGSPRVGRLVAAAAARNLVPVTLELGGKNPALFTGDGVTPDLVRLFLAFRTLKSGQVCTSPDYVMVPVDSLESWIAMAQQVWREAYARYVGHPDATGIINAAHFARLTGYVQEARDRGARIVGLNDDLPDAALRQIPPTLVVQPTDDMSCMREEIFGPIIPVVTYVSLVEAIARINAGPSPLASYIATHDDAAARRFVEHVRSGGSAVNNFGLQGGHAALPFGGFGASGHGCHSARDGVLGYTHAKSVFWGAADSIVHQVLTPPLSALTQYAADGMYVETPET